METYRANPELIKVYNAEAKAIELLPQYQHIITADHNRVAIKKQDEALAALENAAPTDLATASGRDFDPTVELEKPLDWDKNWPWDFWLHLVQLEQFLNNKNVKLSIAPVISQTIFQYGKNKLEHDVRFVLNSIKSIFFPL